MAADTRDLDRLLTTLSAAVYDAPKKTRKVASRGAFNIKRDWRKRWSRKPHIRLLMLGIGYDLNQNPVIVEAEIGPAADSPQAPLGHLIEYGSPTSPPIPGGLAALAAEEPKFLSQLEKLALELLEA